MLKHAWKVSYSKNRNQLSSKYKKRLKETIKQYIFGRKDSPFDIEQTVDCLKVNYIFYGDDVNRISKKEHHKTLVPMRKKSALISF